MKLNDFHDDKQSESINFAVKKENAVIRLFHYMQ